MEHFGRSSRVDLPDGSAFAGQLSIKTFKNGKLVRESGPFKNKVVSSEGYGRNLLLRAMAGEATYPIVIDSAAVGNGTVAPTDADTALGAALVSSLPVTAYSVLNNVLSIDVFVADANLANNTYKEFGLFAAGRLISRLLVSPNYTKASGEDTLFAYTLTLTG